MVSALREQDGQFRLTTKKGGFTMMDLSNLSRKGLEEALQKALSLLPPEGVEEVVATFPERLPAIDHTKQKTSEALGITEKSFYTVAEAVEELARRFAQGGEQLRSVHVQSILRTWSTYDEREKALFAVLLAEATLRHLAKLFAERFAEVVIQARRREAEDEGH